ncbi:MAG: hypothetical protein LBT56_00535 [Prevotellaceae bacterium]|jgi:hypothetical protein|nr:hypothetical protein [Prevotellaceae bacterium]
MKITFFKIPKHRVFEYKPRYYDANKEELDERVRKIEESLNSDKEYTFKRENINFKKAYLKDKKRTDVKLPNKRLFVYVAILLFVVAAFVAIRNFAYLINPENYTRNSKIENANAAEKYDWSPDTQFVIVDEDEDIDTTENANIDTIKNTSEQ